MKLDPYRWQQAQDRRNANLARRAQLNAEREAAMGDAVQGIPTTFAESLDSAGQAPLSTVPRDDQGNPIGELPHELPTSPHILNFQLSQQEVDEAIAESYQLMKPVPGSNSSASASLSAPNNPGNTSLAAPGQVGAGAVGALALDERDQAALSLRPEDYEATHRKAVEALRRITTLENGSSKDIRHANIRRIVETFGRHNTDSEVRQKGLAHGQTERFEKVRGGPDTGSSEVQIAILTAKIRVLNRMYRGPRGNKDKHNKKNLRLLLHRRQKLLAYMERKERGSGRWEKLIETLGLTPATWKQEIELR